MLRATCISFQLNLTFWILFRRRKPQRDTPANGTSSEKRQWKVRLFEGIDRRWRSVDVKIFQGRKIPSLDTLINKREKRRDDCLETTVRGYCICRAIRNINFQLARKHTRMFIRDILCRENRTVFRERSSRETVILEEQIMSNWTTHIRLLLCLLSFKHFAQHAQFRKLRNISQIFSSFGHVTRLDQSRSGENIWWIIKTMNAETEN